MSATHRVHFTFRCFGRLAAALVCLGFAFNARAEDNVPKRPNVVLIMTDNHGAWTLGCYGNRDIRTPHLDQLAKDGLLFSRAFASNPVCSPTRATFLTGLIPSQHGVHCYLTAGRLQVGPEARCTLDQFTSLPEILREAGYSCGLVGKWHLGNNLKPQEGFDDYWITMPHGGTTTFYNAPIIENGKIRQEPQYLTDFWSDHAVKFIERKADKDQPFFLFLAYNGPYALGGLLHRESQNRHAAYYATRDLPSFPREPVHPWQFNNRDYINNPTSIRRVAAEVSGVDDGVGQVIQALKRQGLEENTIVIFVADQGWAGGHGGFFGMGDHTRPITARDDMMRIPMIWKHPKHVSANTRSDVMVTNYDFLPTLLHYLGLGDKVPNQPRSPGRDFSPVLRGKPVKQWDNTVFQEFENLRCIRTDRWKYVHRHPNGPHELYDLQNDPSEFNNLVDQPQHLATRRQLKQKLEDFFAKYAEPKYDLYKGGGSQTKLLTAIDANVKIPQPPAVEPPPLPEGFTPPKINVPEGYTVELAAGPPLVTHPTLGCFDDRGRLYICNNAGVNLGAKELEEQLPNAIYRLEDTDQDGRFDRRTIFADKMTFPMGGAWHNGSLCVASPPYIWRLTDTDNDGIADERKIIVSQFGYTGNAASIHGCFNGPDGRLYWCDGYHGHEFRDEDGKITSKREGSYLFSCKADGSDVRIHCGGGMDNPVEVDFTPAGEMLGTVNILYSHPRVDCLVHWLYGGAYPHRERVLQEIKTTGELLGPVHKFGHVAVSGVTRYRSGLMDHHWTDSLFATFFNSGKVVRLEPEREGATFKVTQREFLSSPSRDFHPTDVIEDADGSLLVVDTGGWFYRGCPTSQLSKPDVLGGIYRIKRRGMTPPVDPWGKQLDWPKLTDAKAVALLNDARHAVRERAINECANRGHVIIPLLKRTLERRDGRERLNAVWALTRLIGSETTPSPQAQAAIRGALEDQSPTIRLAACRSLSTYPDHQAISQLLVLLTADEPAIRREAATALGRLGNSKAVPALLQSLARKPDRTEEHAILYALIEINDFEQIALGLSSDSANVQRGTLIALEQINPQQLTLKHVAALLDRDDESLRRVVLNVYRRHASDPAWGSSAEQLIRQWLENKTLTADRHETIIGLFSAFAAQEPIAQLIGQTLQNAKVPEATREALFGALAGGRGWPLHPSWVEPLKDRLTSADPKTVELAIAAIAALNTDQFNSQLTDLGQNSNSPSITRVLALAALSGGERRLGDAGFELLLELLRGPSGAGELARAVQMIGSSSLKPAQLIALAPELKRAGPLELGQLIGPYRQNVQLEVARTFLDSMEQARSLNSLMPNELSDVVKSYPAELRDRANALVDRLKAEQQVRLNRVDQLLARLKEGDVERGKAVFFSEKSQCATCHRVLDQGQRLGPDLTTIGDNRSASDLLESITFPSATLVRDYEPYSIATTSGQILSGFIVRETASEIVVQQQLGEPVRIPRTEIEEMRPSSVSIMPNGLEKALTEPELLDVIAFLQSLRKSDNVP